MPRVRLLRMILWKLTIIEAMMADTVVLQVNINPYDCYWDILLGLLVKSIHALASQ